VADLAAHDAGPPAPRAAAGRDGRATASLVLGIVALVVPVAPFIASILAIVLGALALRDLGARPERAGRGAATAGIACGAIALVLHVVLLAVWLGGGFG
jgi:ABC-type dipeptide/oligopeptide/nickel transport system permease component